MMHIQRDTAFYTQFEPPKDTIRCRFTVVVVVFILQSICVLREKQLLNKHLVFIVENRTIVIKTTTVCSNDVRVDYKWRKRFGLGDIQNKSNLT